MRHQGEMPIEVLAGHGLDSRKAMLGCSPVAKERVRSLQSFAQVAGEKPRVRVAHDHITRHRRILQPAQQMLADWRTKLGQYWKLGYGVR